MNDRKLEEINAIADELQDAAKLLNDLRNQLNYESELHDGYVDAALAVARLAKDRNKQIINMVSLMRSPRVSASIMYARAGQRFLCRGDV